MRVGEAREWIGEAVVGAVRAGFARDHETMGYAERPAPEPAFKTGRERAGHDSSRVPEVSKALGASWTTDDTPGMFFMVKAEYGGPALIQLSVRRTWARQVAAPGWAAARSWTSSTGTRASPRAVRPGSGRAGLARLRRGHARLTGPRGQPRPARRLEPAGPGHTRHAVGRASRWPRARISVPAWGRRLARCCRSVLAQSSAFAQISFLAAELDGHCERPPGCRRADFPAPTTCRAAGPATGRRRCRPCELHRGRATARCRSGVVHGVARRLRLLRRGGREVLGGTSGRG